METPNPGPGGTPGADEKKPEKSSSKEKVETVDGDEDNKDDAKEEGAGNEKKPGDKPGDKPGEDKKEGDKDKPGDEKEGVDKKEGDKKEEDKKEGEKKEDKKDKDKPDDEKHEGDKKEDGKEESEKKKSDSPGGEKKEDDKKEEPGEVKPETKDGMPTTPPFVPAKLPPSFAAAAMSPPTFPTSPSPTSPSPTSPSPTSPSPTSTASPTLTKTSSPTSITSPQPTTTKTSSPTSITTPSPTTSTTTSPTSVTTSPTTTKTPSPTLVSTSPPPGPSTVGAPTIMSVPKELVKINTSPVSRRIGRKVNPKDLRPVEAVIKTRDRRSKEKKSGRDKSSSGSTTPTIMTTPSGKSVSGVRVPSGKILDYSGATTIIDEEHFKKSKGVLVLREREVATGTYSLYYRVKLQSGEDQAVKILTLMNTTPAYKDNLMSQSSRIMRWLMDNPHDSIVKPLDLFITKDRFYMFVPNYSFGNLESLVTPKSAPTEEKIKKLMKQMADGMQFLASKSIAHKAIKTTHGVFSSADKKQVKLCGFGNAIVARESGSVILQKKVTKENFIPYMAPEVLKADYDPFVADVFSFGAMIVALLTKRYPFGPYKQSRKRSDQWRQRFQRFGVKPSNDLEDLIDKLVADPQSRISLEDLLKHRWFNA